MEEYKIYEFQAKQIEDTLRAVSNRLNSRSKKTCLDRDIMMSWQFIENVLNKETDKQVTRF